MTYVAQFTAVPKEEHEHTYGEPSYEWAEDNSSCTAAVVCTSCTEGTEGHTLTETVEPAEAVVTAPACETAGEKRLTATFENELFESQTKTVVIPAKGHNWDYENIVWKWTALRGGYTAEATLTCKDCGETETIPANVTETESGVYTATITDPDGNQYHDTKTEIQAGTITITASKTEVRVGDTVTFTITMGPVENLSSMQMVLDIPEGLTFKSGDFSDAFKEAIVAIEGIQSFDDVEFFTFASAGNLMISGFIGVDQTSQYTSTSETVIGTFTCEVTSAFSGTKTVGLTEDDLEFRTLDEEEIPMEAFGVDITLNNVFTITFVNEDGTTLDTQTVEYGETPEYGGETPTKQATAQYSYSFAGWDPEIVPAVADATYTATYTETVNKYTVKFVDEDGETVLLAAAEYNYGTPAADIVTPADPTKEATAQYSYSFAGWDPEITEVTADVTYRATYTSTVNKYTVTFVDEDGETVLLEAAEYDYGTAAADIVTPADPTKEATAQYTFTFAGWDPELADVTADVTYKATYTSTVNEYTITFVNYDGSVLQTGKVKYGETPVYSGETPTRPATAEFTYTFTGGWDPAITAVTGDATYTAVYTTAINTYGVSGTVESFTIEALDGVTYGSGTVTLTLVPAVESEDPITVTAAEDGTYSFQAVPVGTYELQVSKADHATRNYTVEVVDKAVTQDVKIQLLGDINGDGKVAAIDLALINWYVTGVKEPDDPYKKACADVNMDGEISTVEIGYINSHVKKASIIWAVIKNAQP